MNLCRELASNSNRAAQRIKTKIITMEKTNTTEKTKYVLKIKDVEYTGEVEDLAKIHRLTPMQVIIQGRPLFVPDPKHNPEYFKNEPRRTKKARIKKLRGHYDAMQVLLAQLLLPPLPKFKDFIKPKTHQENEQK